MAGKNIKELIAAGKTAEAIRVLSDYYKGSHEEQELILIQGIFNRLLEDKNLLNRENFNLEINRINKSLYDLAAKTFKADDQPANQIDFTQKYRCDRLPQIKSFEKAYLLTCEHDLLQFYVVHGNKSQSPWSFCQRLHAFEIPRFVVETNPLETIELVPDEDMVFLRKKIICELNRLFFPGKQPKLDLEKDHINDYTASPIFQRYQGNVINIKLEEDYWRPCVPEFLKWFIHDFCEPSRYTSECKLLFIIQINYNEPEPSNSFWSFQKKKSSVDLSPSLRTVQKLNILPKLGPISKEDILHWFEMVSINNFEDQKKIYQQYFGHVKELSMAEAEKKFEQIISDMNHF